MVLAISNVYSRRSLLMIRFWTERTQAEEPRSSRVTLVSNFAPVQFRAELAGTPRQLAGSLSSARRLGRSHELGFTGCMVLAMLQMRIAGEAY